MDIVQKKKEILDRLEATSYSIFDGNKNLGITNIDYQIETLQNSIKAINRSKQGSKISNSPTNNITKLLLKRIKDAIDQLNTVSKKLGITDFMSINTNDPQELLKATDELAIAIEAINN